jgi:hypothetical protein
VLDEPELLIRSCPTSGAAGPAFVWMAVFCRDVTDGAVDSTVTGCTCRASTTLAATGGSATAGASALVEYSVAAGAGG